FGTHSEANTAQLFKETCNLFAVTKDLPTITTHFLSRKDSPFNKRIDEAILQSDAFLRRNIIKYVESPFRPFARGTKNCTEQERIPPAAQPF
ncbi:hypothetical protein PFISCL1PPCAC_19373, partial [Pristionchus fissidentatus]